MVNALPALVGQKVLVTGGAGFIGARVVARARAAGALVTALVRSTARERLAGLADVACVTVDVMDHPGMIQALASAAPDVVVHAAGIANWLQDPELTVSMVRTHALGAAHLLEAARQARVKRVVLIGSAGEYGDAPPPCREDGPTRPLEAYSASKLAATELALTYHRSFGVACTIVRPFVVYGPGEPPGRLLSSVFATARAGGGPAPFTAGEQVRDFVYVDDVAEGVLRAAMHPSAAGLVLNLGTGVPTRVRDAVALAVETSGNIVAPQFGALVYRPGEPPVLVASCTHTRKVLDWVPTISLADGLRDFWNWRPHGEA